MIVVVTKTKDPRCAQARIRHVSPSYSPLTATFSANLETLQVLKSLLYVNHC